MARTPTDADARRDQRRWLLGLVMVTACSWGRWAATGSLKVDESYPTDGVGTLLFTVLLAGWTLMVLGWRGMLARPPAEPRRLAFAGLAIAALMLPMISNDVFSVLAYGSLAARGQDVYTTAAALPQSVWYGWIGEHWSDKVCVYGPTTLVAILPSALAGDNPWLAILLLRLTWFVPLALVMELSFRRMRDRPHFHAMVWLNPLFVLEGAGQLHADVLGLAAVVCGIVLGLRGRARASAVLYALAVLGKYSFAFAGSWFWLHDARTPRERLLRFPIIAACLLAVGVVFFAPFWHGVATLTEPIRALSGMNPGGSITEVVGILVNLLRGGGIPHADAPVQGALALDRASSGATWFVVSLVLRLVTLGVGLHLLRWMFREPHDDERVALGTGALVIAAITLASHRFQAWYLIAALPFFGLCCTEAWRRWWVAVVAVAPTTEFVYVLPRTSLVLPVWVAVTTGATVILFLAWFRARFVSLAAGAPRGATAPGAR